MCSQNRQRNNFYYDSVDANGEYQIDKVEYIGLSCDCIGLSTATSCKHSVAVSDFGVIGYLQNMLNSNAR